MNNPAFDLIRTHYKVEPETEALVIKKTYGRINPVDLFNCFENGISGKYGKVYKADPQTLIGWVDQFLKTKNSNSNYVNTGLLSPSVKVTDIEYPQKDLEWHKEINKCFTAFNNGVACENFHADCLMYLLLDGKANREIYLKYVPANYPLCEKEDIKTAYQKGLVDFFRKCKAMGWNQIYFIK